MSEKINLKEDRDFFTREFRKNVLTESTGGYLWNLLDRLSIAIYNLPESTTSITPNDVDKLNKALDALEKTMKQVLKGKGLIRW